MIESPDEQARLLEPLLQLCSSGDRAAFGAVFTLLYRDVRSIAARSLRHESVVRLQPTEVVHEVYLRLAGLERLEWRNRGHVLAMATRVTRQALVDEARRLRSDKRDGGVQVTLSDDQLGLSSGSFDAVDMDRLLRELSEYDKLAAEVVALRVFGGLTIEETAEALEISTATANRHWSAGKIWLVRELSRP